MNQLLDIYRMLTAILEKGRWMPLFLARLSIGSIFVISGWGKLHDIPKVVSYFTDLGIPMPEFQAHLVAATEFGCGTLILLGLFTRLASIPLTVTMIVAILTAKMSDIHGVTDLFGIDEFLYIVFFLFFVFNGAGSISLDSLLRRLRGGQGPEIIGEQLRRRNA